MQPKKQAQSVELELLNMISSFIKEKSGRGPSDVKIRLVDNMLIYFIYGVLTPLEKSILKAPDGETVVLEGRKRMVKSGNKERLAGFERILQAQVIDHFESWNLESDTAVGLVLFDKNIE